MSSPVTIKNHNEILRCFAVISEYYNVLAPLHLLLSLFYSKRLLKQSHCVSFAKAGKWPRKNAFGHFGYCEALDQFLQ